MGLLDPPAPDVRAIAPGFKLYNPAALQNWMVALADAQFKAAPITIEGHSIVVGIGADNIGSDGDEVVFRTQGWVAQLRNLLARRYGDPGEGFIGTKDYNTDGTGVRRAVAGGATFDVGVGPFYNGSRMNSNTQTTTWTTVSTGTIVKFWVWWGSAMAGATFAIDGGSNTASYIDPADGTTKTTAANTFPTISTGDVNNLQFVEFTVTGLSDATHSIVFTGPTTGSLRMGDIAILKQLTGVPVHRLGWSGATSANLVGLDSTLSANTLGQTRMMTAGTRQFGSKLLIIEMGTNDYGLQNSRGTGQTQPGTTSAEFIANIKTRGDIAIADGASVLLVGDPRRQTAPVTPEGSTEESYYAALKNLAQTNAGYAYLDTADVIGAASKALSLGYAKTLTVHPKRAGHGRMALAIYSAITEPYGVSAPSS